MSAAKRFVPEDWMAYGGETGEALEEIEHAIDRDLPDDYKEFMAHYGGGEGFVGDGYLMLWRPADVLQYNREYNVEEQIPGFLVIGSNGGGEAFAYDLRKDACPIIMVPFIGMEEELAELVGKDIEGLFSFTAEPIL